MFTIKNNIKIPIYKQIYDHLRSEILSGRLASGTRLMSSREMAAKYDISRNTVENAYSQLMVEGYISSRERSGYTVMDIKSDPFFADMARTSQVTEKPRKTYRYDFHFANLEAGLFPSSLWRKYTAQALLLYDMNQINSYVDGQGDIKLREHIAKHLETTRGVNCRPDQVLLTSGTQPAIDLICKLFAVEERSVAFEEPGYDAVRKLFEINNYSIFPVEVGAKGLTIENLKKIKAKLVYVIPSHQFPTGVLMPVKERQLLIEYAWENNSFIIEDDYDNELHYNSRPIQSLQSLDRNGRVMYLGTFSKSFSPGLRLAYIVLPDTLTEKYNRIFNRYYCTIPWITQQVLRLYIENGHWKRHLRVIHTASKKKHDTLIQSIEEYMGSHVKIYGKNAGLHIMLEILDGRDQQELMELAAQYDIRVYPTAQYWHQIENAQRNTVMLGFAGLSENNIPEGIKTLAQAWFGQLN